MCPQNKLTAKRIPRARDHIHSHYKRAIPFKGQLAADYEMFVMILCVVMKNSDAVDINLLMIQMDELINSFDLLLVNRFIDQVIDN